MNVKIENIKNLLESSGRVAKHQEEIKRLRGENFNVFSILGMESRENETHSAFVGELLNPNGSHYFGNCFLKLFLKNVASFLVSIFQEYETDGQGVIV